MTKEPGAEILIGLASLYYLYRKLESALDILNLAEHIESNNLSVIEFMVVIKFELGDFHGALKSIAILENSDITLPKEIVAAKEHVLRFLHSEAVR